MAETIWLSPEVANDPGSGSGAGRPIGGGDGVGGYAPLAVVTGAGTGAVLSWVHGGHLGVPLLFTNASGTAVTPAAYTMPGFPGQLKTLSDLYYNRYRDYDSSTGRYIQADPIGLGGGANDYLYADGNPIKFIDGNGLEVIVGQHGAFYQWVPFKHAAIILRPDNLQDFKNDPMFKNGAKQATLGGQMGGSGVIGLFGGLGKEVNFSGDNPCNLTDLTVVRAPPGMSDTQSIRALQDSFNRYDNKLAYVPFPAPGGAGYNSNGFVSGLLRSVGAVAPNLPGNRPGYTKPIPNP